ncbi:MAG: hypothetical protein II628_05835, partial [Lachnospiraceae bacterium]|nr:hypothetical protein [Lachnospiraceae bacterium]
MRGWHIWKKRISAALACVVMFVTVYLMVLPAITLDLDTAEDDESIVMEEAVDPEETEGASEAWEVPEGEEDPSGQAMEEELSGAETDSGGESRRDQEEREELKKQADPGKDSRTLTGEEEGYVFNVSFGEDAMLPSDVSLRTREIPAGTQEYDKYMERALDAVRKEEGEEALISYARFFDIAFVKDGKEVEPAGPVSLVIGCRKSPKDRAEEAESSALNTAGPVSMKETDAVNVVHFDDRESSEPALMDIETRVKDELVESISFEADSFSVYGVVGTVIEKKILTGDGKSYKVTVTYG